MHEYYKTNFRNLKVSRLVAAGLTIYSDHFFYIFFSREGEKLLPSNSFNTVDLRSYVINVLFFYDVSAASHNASIYFWAFFLLFLTGSVQLIRGDT